MRFGNLGPSILWVAAATVLSGCAPTMLIGGTLDNTIQATVDPASFSAAAKGMLAKAKTLGIVSLDRSSIKAADVFETRGGYIVKIDRQAAKQGEMTGSERREALSNLCRDRGVDVAMLGRVLKTDTGNMIGTMFSGRMKTTLNWTMEMLACNSKSTEAFGGTLLIDAGIYNANPAKLEEDIGAELGSKILAAIGTTASAAAVTPAAPAAAKQAVGPDAQPVVPAVQPVSTNSRVVAMSMKEVQQMLLSLGYHVGVPDGISGKRTVDALRKYQADNRIPVTGLADEATLQKLSSP